MTITPAALWGPIQLGNGFTNLGTTPPTGGLQVIQRAVFSNPTNAACSISVCILRNGASPVNANTVIGNQSISAFSTYVAVELAGVVLGPGDQICAVPSAPAAVVTIGNGYRQ